MLAEVLEQALEAAQASVERGPELLPVLREHGVVDAGGYGVTLLIAGVIAGLRGDARRDSRRSRTTPSSSSLTAPDHESSRLPLLHELRRLGRRSCAPGRTWVPLLEEHRRLGAGRRRRARRCACTSTPTSPERAVARVRPGRNGRAARRRRHARAGGAARRAPRRGDAARPAPSPSCAAAWSRSRPARACGACTSSSARTWSRAGSTLNPSTFELLAGIHEVAADEVVVLPNSANVILAAERAAELSEKDVAVVESRWPQAGLACLVEHDPDGGLEAERAAAARRARRDRGRARSRRPRATTSRAASRRATPSASSTSEMVAWGDPQRDAAGGARARWPKDREIVTCVSGDGAPLDDAAVAAPRARPGVEIECHDGGQPHYWWLLAAE